MSVLSQNLDKHPYVGKRKATGKLRIKNDKHIENYFNGTVGWEQVKNVTPGKVYEVVGKEGFGDGEDIFFINDIGEIDDLGDYFWEEVEEEEEL